VGIRFFGSYLAENSVKDPGAARDDSAGQSNLPKWKATANLTYANGPASVFITERWADGGTLNRRWVEGVDVDNNHVKAIYYTDLHLGYALGDNQQINLFADITNVFNKDPSIAAAQSVGRTGIGLGASQPSDTVGRRFVLGLKFQY